MLVLEGVGKQRKYTVPGNVCTEKKEEEKNNNIDISPAKSGRQ